MVSHADYWTLHKKAVKKGWKTPSDPNDPLSQEAWVNYWKQLEAQEKDPSSGRPVIPHRSGGRHGI